MLVNDPVPEPSVVLLSDKVGFDAVPQQTPLEVIPAFPSLVTVPPVVAEICVIELTLFVVKKGIEALFLQDPRQMNEKIRGITTSLIG